jgi:hypothetical protein
MLEIFNECGILIVGYHCLMFTSFVPNPRESSAAGLSAIIFTLMNILTNFGLIVMATYYQFKLYFLLGKRKYRQLRIKYKQWKAKRKHLKEKKEFDDIKRIELEKKFNRTFATHGFLVSKLGPQEPEESRANHRYDFHDDEKRIDKSNMCVEESKYD